MNICHPKTCKIIQSWQKFGKYPQAHDISIIVGFRQWTFALFALGHQWLSGFNQPFVCYCLIIFVSKNWLSFTCLESSSSSSSLRTSYSIPIQFYLIVSSGNFGLPWCAWRDCLGGILAAKSGDKRHIRIISSSKKLTPKTIHMRWVKKIIYQFRDPEKQLADHICPVCIDRSISVVIGCCQEPCNRYVNNLCLFMRPIDYYIYYPW